MIRYKPKTRQGEYVFCTVDELIPICKRAVKSFKRITMTTQPRLQELIDHPPPSITSTSRLIDYIRDEVFHLQRGARTEYELREVLGWPEEDIRQHFLAFNKKQINGYRKKYGTKTCLTKEYWLIKGFSEKEAIAKVAEIQTGNSRRVPREIKRTYLKNVISSHHYEGLSEDEAYRELVRHQRRQSKRCLEYWITRGASMDEAILEVSKYQKEQSKFAAPYWIKKGLSPSEAEDRSVQEAIKNFSSLKRFSKQSLEVFDKLQELYPNRIFLYGQNEVAFDASKLGTGRRCFFLDFYEERTKLNIEFDGEFWHKNTKVRDAERDQFLSEAYGIRTLRICTSAKVTDSINNAINFLGPQDVRNDYGPPA